MKKTIMAIVLAVVALSGLALSPVSGQAEARPAPIQAIAPSGHYFWSHAPNCRGPIRLDIYSDRAKPGRVTAKFTPGKFNRNCTVNVWFGWGMMGADQLRIPLRVGPHGGKAVSRTYRTGSGIIFMGGGHRPSATGIQFYTWVP